MRSVIIFPDGASSGNPGPGGWGAVLVGILNPSDRQESVAEVVELGGGGAGVTNNQMELKAALEGLREASRRGLKRVTVASDSSYVIQGATKFISNWKRRGWTTQQGEPVKNQDLWNELDAVLSDVEVEWYRVRGHANVPGNERADAIAVAFSRGERPRLFSGALSAYAVAEIGMLPKPLPPPGQSKEKEFYVSYVNGKLERHATWPECQNRVHGTRGAKYKKVRGEEELERVLKSWGVSETGSD